MERVWKSLEFSKFLLVNGLRSMLLSAAWSEVGRDRLGKPLVPQSFTRICVEISGIAQFLKKDAWRGIVFGSV